MSVAVNVGAALIRIPIPTLVSSCAKMQRLISNGWTEGSVTELTLGTALLPTKIKLYIKVEKESNEPIKLREMDVAIADAQQADDFLKFNLLLSTQGISVIDSTESVWLQIYPYTHWASGSLPPRIALPWGQRQNVSALLEHNCVN